MPLSQPPVLVAAYAAGVLMFFAPCSVGLLPAYLSYYSAHDDGGTVTETNVDVLTRPALLTGTLLFLAGAVPLFYMAMAGIRITLPGYSVLVPLARQGTGSYLPSVGLVVFGTVAVAGTLGGQQLWKGLRIGGYVTLGIVAVYLGVGGVVLVVGEWVRPYLMSLELLAGPLLVLLGLAYAVGWSPSTPVALPERADVSPTAFVGFGVLYGIGSLACNLPVFLGVVLSSFSTAGFAQGLLVFLAFGAGMGTLMIGVSVVMHLGQTTVSLGTYASRVHRLGGLALVGIGLYVSWFTLVSFDVL
ncbi:cytochrome c biogenesis protein CcdA [Halomarina rubra]|uniref:Cytochrome c biogenesis protein CcdA n=1 Tax=Halomarina rubra TaxID=2071873 RepID=A0ABD6AVJ1_9EURY|nr:cytochrome c biogenesis protein CcdA [Halomarina rubra]